MCGQGGEDMMSRQGAEVLFSVVLTLALLGYVVGLHQTEDGGDRSRTTTVTERPVSEGLPNDSWNSGIDTLSSEGIEDVVQTVSDALAERSLRRAYAGAPPVVPHGIDQMDPTGCMACHGEGLRSKSLRAPKMSHDFLSNCTQCHVESKNSQLPPPLNPANAFRGLEEVAHGDRQSPVAPPVMPHRTWMRQDCRSCHGPNGTPGLRTTHPERRNCVQCHAPSAGLDQRPGAAR